MRLNRLEQSIEAHDEAIRLKPDYSDAHVNRGMALLLLKRDDEADQDFDRALALRPRQLQAIVGKGLVSLNRRHFDAALAHFDAALAVSPTAEVLAHRGRLHSHMKQLAKAETDFDAALVSDGKLEIAWRGKAQVAVLRGDVAEATAACNKVLASNPNCEIATLLLGNCYARQGDLQAAIAHIDRALAIKPDFEEAISKKIFTLDFTDVDFAAHQAVRKTWWEAIGVNIPRRELRPRNLDDCSSATCRPTSGIIQPHLRSSRCFGITTAPISKSSVIPARPNATPSPTNADRWSIAGSMPVSFRTAS
jgi:tetratricopeptide (TPR) repeat protein